MTKDIRLHVRLIYGDCMDYIDVLILGVGSIILFEGARRYDLIRLGNRLSKQITNREEVGIEDNSLSYKILTRPSEGTKWSPGIGAAINNRPFLIFMLIILTLGLFGAVVTYVINYTKIGFLLIAIIFAVTFHSGPDNISNGERYLQVINTQDTNVLNGHDVKFIGNTIKEYRSWPLAQILFGILFMSTIFWPDGFFFYGVGLILIIGFCYLGNKYSIQRGVFDSAPRI